MIAADVAGAIALALLAAAVLTGSVTFWMIVVVAFVDTSAAVLYRSGSSGAMKAVVPQPQLADASSVTMARMSTCASSRRRWAARSSTSRAACRFSSTPSRTPSRPLRSC